MYSNWFRSEDFLTPVILLWWGFSHHILLTLVECYIKTNAGPVNVRVWNDIRQAWQGAPSAWACFMLMLIVMWQNRLRLVTVYSKWCSNQICVVKRMALCSWSESDNKNVFSSLFGHTHCRLAPMIVLITHAYCHVHVSIHTLFTKGVFLTRSLSLSTPFYANSNQKHCLKNFLYSAI